MAADFPYLYPYSRADARRLRQTQMHEDSFRVNVDCARAIEQAVRDHFNAADESLAEGCAQSVLEQFGFKRVNFVLANSLQEFRESACKHLVSDETYRWGRKTFVPQDSKYNRCYAGDCWSRSSDRPGTHTRRWDCSAWSTAPVTRWSRTTRARCW